MFKPIPDKDGFSECQVLALSEELDQAKVKACHQGDIEACPVDYSRLIQQANRIFGYGNWDRRIEDGSLVHECVSEEKSDEPIYHFFYTVKVQIIVQPQSDCEASVREALGVGCGSHADPGQAYRLAVKRAEVEGTTKALETYGSQFGLGYGPDLAMSEDSGAKALAGNSEVDGGFFVSNSKAG
jgi:DNA repair and recombination protein RAD52